MGPAPKIMIDLMSVRFLMAFPVVQASKGAATAEVAIEVEVDFAFIAGGGDDERRGCCFEADDEALSLLPLLLLEIAAVTTDRPRPVRTLARGWRADMLVLF